MMLPRLSRALSSSSKGFYPLTTHLHDGVCFVLRSRPRDDGRYGFVHGPPTGALTLTLANHPALPSRLDEATFEDLRDVRSQGDRRRGHGHRLAQRRRRPELL